MGAKAANLDLSMSALWASSQFAGGNAPYLEELYEQYLRDPNSVSPEWRNFFVDLPRVNGIKQDVPHSDVRRYFRELAKHAATTSEDIERSVEALEYEHKQEQVFELIEAYRFRGHQHARLDPLQRHQLPEIPDLSLRQHQLSVADLDTEFATGSLHGPPRATLAEILEIVNATYCSSIGTEYMYITESKEKNWIQQQLESVQGKPKYDIKIRRKIMQDLTAAEGLETYLHSKYIGQKRFSLEGSESLIPMLNEIVQRAGGVGVKEVVIAMAHRGRLNVLVNIMGKLPSDLFQEFEGKRSSSLNGDYSGDVKYHMGFSSDVKTPGGTTHLTLAFNPSHLEIVSPVLQGSVRSRQDRREDSEGNQVLPVSIHGDAAFAGQGVVMETFSMSRSRGYSTKGTVHIVINNQIGFTTSNQKDSRSTLYCTDVAKMVSAPIFHVNGDDPEAVLFVTQLAFDYRMKFKKDVVIDLVCYRRHGHNEADEPSATQPMMYKKIKALPTTRAQYAQRLSEEGIFNNEEIEQFGKEYRDRLDAGLSVQQFLTQRSNEDKKYIVDWSVYFNHEWDQPLNTSISIDRIKQLSDALLTFPDGFELHSRVNKIMSDRKKMAAGSLPIDWGFAEIMAYASLVTEGVPVRISGQDSGRGTFFHRHAVLHNQRNGGGYIPLRNLSKDQANFLVIDSLLSEEAVLAFEYGYSTNDPHSLVIWEAQFGDFANGAQVVVDQFISSGEQKWGRLSGLILLLPHGYEGQGPEHSSARLERFLQLCAQHNMQVCSPTTPAQAFHMLRRQALRQWRTPLVVMSPKSLLRHKQAISSLEDLAEGCFMPVIADDQISDNDAVTKLILCNGKVYYDLIDRRRAEGRQDAAIVRIEQLYPFPEVLLQVELDKYPKLEDVVWCQEEPMNQGAWYASQHHIRGLLREDLYLRYVGRAASASPAVGYSHLHVQQQKELVENAFA